MYQMNTLAITLLKGDVVFLYESDIKFIFSSSSVTSVHDFDQNKYSSIFTVKKFKQLIDNESFYPFSQSLLVNLKVLKYIHNQDQEIELKCGLRLPVSRRGLRGFKEWVKENGGVI